MTKALASQPWQMLSGSVPLCDQAGNTTQQASLLQYGKSVILMKQPSRLCQACVYRPLSGTNTLQNKPGVQPTGRYQIDSTAHIFHDRMSTEQQADWVPSLLV